MTSFIMKRQVAGVTHSVIYIFFFFQKGGKNKFKIEVCINQSFIPRACMAHSKYMTGLVALLPVLSVAIIIPRPYEKNTTNRL
jgi:hypothetical protein